MSVKFTRTALLTTLLLGTLVFTLSGYESPNMTVLSSAEYGMSGDCDAMTTRMAGSDASDSCNISIVDESGTLNGALSVEQIEAQTRDANGELSQTPTKQWKATLKLTCEDDDCGEIDTPIYASMPDYASIVQSAMKQVQAQKPQLIAKLKEAKQRDQDVADCVSDKDGNALEDTALVDCQSKKMKGMSEKDAKNYFDSNIKKTITDLLASSDPTDGERATDMLNEFKTNNTGGRYVNESIQNLAQYGVYRLQERDFASQLTALPPGDPTRMNLMMQMRSAEAQSNAYFANLGIVAKQELWPDNFSADFIASMTSDLTAYRVSVDQSYAEILQQYQDTLSNSNIVNQVVPWGGQPPGTATAAASSAIPAGRPVTSLQNSYSAPLVPASKR